MREARGAGEEARPLGEDRQAPAREGGLRSVRAGSPPRAHGRLPQDAALPAPRAHGRLPDRRFHGNDRRPHRQESDAPAAHEGRGPRECGDVQGAGLQDPRPSKDASRLQLRVALGARRRRPRPPLGEIHGRAPPRARRLCETLSRGKAHRRARASLPALPGLRLRRALGRRRAGRHGPALQPPRRPRPHEGVRAGAAGRHDAPAPRRNGRRREDVEVGWQRDRRRRKSERDLRQGHVDLGCRRCGPTTRS